MLGWGADGGGLGFAGGPLLWGLGSADTVSASNANAENE